MKHTWILACSLSALCFRTIGQQAPAPYLAWEQHITNFSFSALVSDNIGHVAAVGYRTTGASVLLFDTNWQLATANACLPLSTGYQPVEAAADRSGRLFVASASTNINCVRFEPALAAMSRLQSLGGPWYPHNLVPDEEGGAYLGVSYSPHGSIINPYHVRFTCDGTSLFHPTRSGDVNSSIIVRNPDGKLHRISEAGWSRYPEIEVATYSPTGTLLWSTNITPSNDSEFPKTAICDSAGNLIIVGYSKQAEQYGPLYPDVVKLSANGEFLWRRQTTNYGTVFGVATDSEDNVIITGDCGTLKFTTDGDFLWHNPIRGEAVQITKQDDIVISRPTIPITWQNFREIPPHVETAKLDGDGTLAWQATYRTETNGTHWVAGIVVDERGVYVAISHGYMQPGASTHGVIVKYLDSATNLEHGRPVIDPPAVVDCDSFIVGPCDPFTRHPKLWIHRSNDLVRIRWPAAATNFYLEARTTSTAAWIPTTNVPSADEKWRWNDLKAIDQRFFRLRQLP